MRLRPRVSILGVCLLGLTVRAQAPVSPGVQPLPEQPISERQGYEGALIQDAMQSMGLQRELAPEGKTIGEVKIITGDVVGPRDPWPNLLNVFHVVTKDGIIRRELLLKPGEAYREVLARETERILRLLGSGTDILAVARVLPVVSPIPGQVDVLVVTKDLWSIRLNSSYTLIGTALRYLRVRPSEQNFLGRNKQLSLDFQLDPATYSLGLIFSDRRFLGTPLTFEQNGLVILNRRSGRAEGFQTGISLGRELYALGDAWGYGVAANWSIQQARQFRGLDIVGIPFPDETNPTATLPFQYRSESGGAVAHVTRSYGYSVKTNLTLNAGIYRVQYQPGVSLTPDQRTFLIQKFLPHSEAATYLGASVNRYEARYVVLRNINSFALSEDFRLGPTATAALRYAPSLFYGYQFLEMGASLGYRFYRGDNLFSVASSAALRWVPGATGEGRNGNWVNRRVGVEAVDYSPKVWIGRFVAHLLVDLRFDDLDNPLNFIGGASGIRGLADAALVGPHKTVWNLEYRTKPWVIATLHLGGVLFWDAGSAFVRGPNFTHTVGLGIRALFPQLDTLPIRIDFGYVVRGDRPAFLDRFSSSFGQVNQLPQPFLTHPLN